MRLLILLFVLLLSACGPIYQTTYGYIPPKSNIGKMCAMQCQQTKMLCQQLSQSGQDNCRNNARQQAMFDYQSYKHERRQAGKSIDKDLNDFYNDFGCSRDTSNCDQAYNSCFSTCGGQVIPTTVCVAFCNKN